MEILSILLNNAATMILSRFHPTEFLEYVKHRIVRDALNLAFQDGFSVGKSSPFHETNLKVCLELACVFFAGGSMSAYNEIETEHRRPVAQRHVLAMKDDRK